MRGNYVMLRAGGLRLVLPQEDVGAAHYLDGATVEDDCAGYEALSEDMKPMPKRPRERFIACELRGGPEGVAWCWDELRVLIDVELAAFPLPEALQGADSPIRSYVELDGAPAFLSSAADVCRYAVAAELGS
jgi:hypothetical protein